MKTKESNIPITSIKYNDIEIPIEFLKQTTVYVNGNRYIQLQQENKSQKEIINKAIEYVKENSKKYYRGWSEDDCSTEIYLDEDEVFKLLSILEDKEVQ